MLLGCLQEGSTEMNVLVANEKKEQERKEKIIWMDDTV